MFIDSRLIINYNSGKHNFGSFFYFIVYGYLENISLFRFCVHEL